MVACPSPPCPSPSGSGSSPPRARGGGSTRARSPSTSPTPAALGDAAQEGLHTPDDLTAWLRERFPVAVGVARSRDLFDAVALRDAIWRMAVASAHGEPARAGRHRPREPLRGDARHPAGARRRLAAGRPLGADRRAGAVDDRTRRRRPLRPRERRPHPRVQRRRLRDGLPRHLACGHPPVVLDAALRQPCEGARAPRPEGGAARPDRPARPAGPAPPAASGEEDAAPQLGHHARRVTLAREPHVGAEALLDELDRAARRADEVRGRVAQPLERGARDGGLGRRVVDAEPDEGVDDRAGGQLVLDREPDRLAARRPRATSRSPAATIATIVRSPRSSCRARIRRATAVRLRRAPASTTTPRSASGGDRAAVRRREHHRPSSSSTASAPVKLVGESEGPASPRRPATTPPSRSASAAAPAASPAGHGATGTPRSAAATTAVVNDSTSTTTTTCAPGRMRSAPAAPQSNRTWYFAWPNGALESLTATG